MRQPVPEEGRELEIKFNHVANNLINHAYRMRPHCGSWTQNLQELPGWPAPGWLGEGPALGPWGRGMGALHLGFSQHLPYLSFHSAVPELHQ